MAVAGLKTCHFVTYTSKGIFIVTITFNDKFWATVVAADYKFYCQQIVLSFLMKPYLVKIFTQNSYPKDKKINKFKK